jgi:hypothetical protein
MALNLFDNKKKKIVGAIFLLIVVLLAILFALPIFGTGAYPLVSGGGPTIGGGAAIHQMPIGAYR